MMTSNDKLADMGSAVPVILFRTPTDPPGSDQYHQTLCGVYRAISVPVLEEVFDVDELGSILRGKDARSEGGGEGWEGEGGGGECKGGGEGWAGVVITSKRGAEGWTRAVDSIIQQATDRLEHEPDGTSPPHDLQFQPFDWSTIPLWTVGTSASETITAYANQGERQRRFCPCASGDRTAKSAKELISLLLAQPHPHSQSQSQSQLDEGQGRSDRPYLLIRGDKSLEEIPQALHKAGKNLKEVMVYSTSARQTLTDDIARAFTGLAPGSRIWLAFFSPSSAGYVIPLLPDGFLGSEGTRVAAIGETTRAYLEGRGVGVHAIAEEPGAKGLLAAMIKADGQAGANM